MKKLKVKKVKILIGVCVVLLVVIMNAFSFYKNEEMIVNQPIEALAYHTEDYIYLSDIPYIQEDSYAGSSIKLDKNEDKGQDS